MLSFTKTFCAIAAITATSAFADITSGLVLHWTFDDCTATDISGNGNNGTLQNVTCTTGVNGQSFEFNGYNSYISSTIPIVKKKYSVSMFVKFKSNDSTENQLFYLTRPGYTDRLGYLSTYPIGSKTWHWGAIDTTGSLYHWAERASVASDSTALASNVWHHAVFVLNDTNISLYINGVLLHTIKSIYKTDIERNSNLLFLVGGTSEGYQHMNGYIDDVRFYNKALTKDDVFALYKNLTNAIKNDVFSNTDSCIADPNWCNHPVFTALGVTSESDIPIKLINSSYIIDNFEKTNTDRTTHIKANVYNLRYADAMIDIYNKKGEWTGFIPIDGNRPKTTIIGDTWNNWVNIYDSYVDNYSILDPRDAGASTKLLVDFMIPSGGYAVLSKNSVSAITNTFLTNALDIFGEHEWIKQNGKKRAKLMKIFANKIISEGVLTLFDSLKDAANRNDNAAAESITAQLMTKLSSIAFDIFKSNNAEVIAVIGDKKAISFAKKATKYFSPLGTLAGGAEKFALTLSIIGQWIDIAKANNDRAVYFK